MVIAAPAVAFRVIAPFDLTAVALDRFGNIGTNYQGTVTFSISDTDAGVMLPADYTFQPSDGGMAILRVTLITPGEETRTVTDTASGITGSATVTVSSPAARPSGRGRGPRATTLARPHPARG